MQRARLGRRIDVASRGQHNTPVRDPAEAHVGATRPTHQRLQQTETNSSRLRLSPTGRMGSGVVASRAEEYRRRAQRCLKMARAFGDPDARVTLAHMAQAWLRLAG